MSNKLEAVSVFGVNPDTNAKVDLESRLLKLESVLIDHEPQQLIFLGGETWEQDGVITNEAAFIATAVKERFSQLLPVSIVELPLGLETITQTHALIEFLRERELDPSNLGMISTWHQLLRSGTIFWTERENLPTMFPVFSSGSTKEILYDILINALAGVGYTFLSEMIRRTGRWTDGGPLIRSIAQERTERTGYSWYNTLSRSE